MDHIAAVGTLGVHSRPLIAGFVADQELAGRDLRVADRAGAECRALSTHGITSPPVPCNGGERVTR